MRDIKFRYRLKIMGFADEPFFYEMTLAFIEDRTNKAIFRNFTILSRDQFTGLKDKNDVEIYDGDILKTYHDGNKVVHFYRGAFCIDFENRDVGGVNSVPLKSLTTKNMEVIGNIHENPELL